MKTIAILEFLIGSYFIYNMYLINDSIVLFISFMCIMIAYTVLTIFNDVKHNKSFNKPEHPFLDNKSYEEINPTDMEEQPLVKDLCEYALSKGFNPSLEVQVDENGMLQNFLMDVLVTDKEQKAEVLLEVKLLDSSIKPTSSTYKAILAEACEELDKKTPLKQA